MVESSQISIEQLDQEITLNLQKIDSNLSYCFNTITQEIIPHVTKYGAVCDQVMDSCNWLKEMFQQSGNVELAANTEGIDSNDKSATFTKVFPETIFPLASKPTDSSDMLTPPVARLNVNDSTQEFHTANITATTTTTTGKVLQLPDSSDEENDHKTQQHQQDTNTDDGDGDGDGDGSTVQKQRRKRKMSLLLQRQFDSDSSGTPSPVTTKKHRHMVVDSEYNEKSINSSPVKQDVDAGQEESTKEVPKSGTVIRFSTKS